MEHPATRSVAYQINEPRLVVGDGTRGCGARCATSSSDPFLKVVLAPQINRLRVGIHDPVRRSVDRGIYSPPSTPQSTLRPVSSLLP